ncbi:hypothetical protein ACH5RR_029712 [Cinchona calisaya]|uniref:Uncharacterized protein n=1 Tax=Cinchona calisaya TaxID=153742 RepID=A0ABD2YUR5_9GENT
MINFDVGVFQDVECADIGTVVRDGKGQLVAGLTKRIVRMSRPQIAELVSARRSLEFGAELKNWWRRDGYSGLDQFFVSFYCYLG